MQFQGEHPADLLRATADWLTQNDTPPVVALNWTEFDLLGPNPHGGGYLLDLVVDPGALRVTP